MEFVCRLCWGCAAVVNNKKIRKLSYKAREHGAKSLRMRLDYNKNPTKPNLFGNEIIQFVRNISECDVCWAAELTGFDIPVSIHWGVLEPSNIEGYEEHEYIINHGMWYDYARTKPVEINKHDCSYVHSCRASCSALKPTRSCGRGGCK